MLNSAGKLLRAQRRHGACPWPHGKSAGEGCDHRHTGRDVQVPTGTCGCLTGRSPLLAWHLQYKYHFQNRLSMTFPFPCHTYKCCHPGLKWRWACPGQQKALLKLQPDSSKFCLPASFALLFASPGSCAACAWLRQILHPLKTALEPGADTWSVLAPTCMLMTGCPRACDHTSPPALQCLSAQ